MANPQTENGYTQIPNEILEKLIALHLSPNQWQVLLCIIRKTCGFHKKVDYIANFQIVEATGLCKEVVSRSIKALIAMNIIHRNGKHIGIRDDWRQWKLAKQSTSRIENNNNHRLLRIVRTDGYVGIWYGTVEPEFQGMATKQGYILEHRLVVARKLGRCLEPWEVVHHKDGVPSHNSEDNLELLPSQKEHMPSILAQQRIKQLETELAGLRTLVDDKLAISPSTIAISSTKVSSPHVTQKKKETIQKKDSGSKEPPDPRVSQIMLTLEQRQGYQFAHYAKEVPSVKRALQMGYTPEQFIGCWEKMKAENFWKGRALPLAKVVENLGEYAKSSHSDSRIPEHYTEVDDL